MTQNRRDEGRSPEDDVERRALDIVDRAIELPEDERALYVVRACGGDTALRERVENLLLADARTVTFLDGEARDPGSLRVPEHGTPGTLIADRYRLGTRLGAGGMGAVFRAWDEVLERDVAIKFLREFTIGELGRHRLLQEARAASSLSHANICSVHDVISTDAGGLVLVMSYCSGPTLRERIEAGPLRIDEAVRIGADIAAGLAAAHDAGVVHRDIKPGNVMLDPGGAKLVDFGIAKTDGVDLTRTGVLLGTLAYMSPEQAVGEPVGAASDLWSLGVVLFEMLAGRTPFHAAGGVSVISKILSEDVPSVRLARPEVPELLAELVHQLLARRPGDRPGSAGSVERRLRALSHAPPESPTNSIERVPTGSGRYWRWAVGALTLSVGAVALWLAGTTAAPPDAADPVDGEAEAPVFIVADFASDDPALGRTVSQALSIDLAQSPALRLASDRVVSEGLTRMARALDQALDRETALEIAARVGLPGVISGEVRRAGPGYLLAVELLATRSGASVVARRATAEDDAAVLGAIDRLSKEFREALGESVVSLRSAPPLERVTTTSLDALRSYTRARRTHVVSGDLERAIVLYEEAIAHDSTFAMAHVGLGTLLASNGIRPARALEALRAGYRLRERLADEERHLAEAAFHMNVTRDIPAAVNAYESALEIDPDNYAARHNLGTLNQFTRNHEEGLRHYRLATDIDSTVYLGWLNQATALAFLGRTDDALLALDEGERRFPDNPQVWAGYGGPVLAAALRWNGAAERYERLLTVSGDDPVQTVYALEGLADLALLRGKRNEALRLRAMIAESHAARGRTLEYLENAAQVAFMHAIVFGDRGEASAALDEGLRRYPFERLDPAGRPYLELASALAWAGRTAEARSLLDQFEAHGFETLISPVRDGDAGLERARGTLALVEGRYTDATLHFRAGDVGMCHICSPPGLAIAYDRAQMPDSAMATYSWYIRTTHPSRQGEPSIFTGPWGDRYFRAFALERLGQLHEAAGAADQATRYFEEFVALWAEADPELQERVRAARARIEAIRASSP